MKMVENGTGVTQSSQRVIRRIAIVKARNTSYVAGVRAKVSVKFVNALQWAVSDMLPASTNEIVD